MPIPKIVCTYLNAFPKQACIDPSTKIRSSNQENSLAPKNVGKTAISRFRRIMNGEEVVLTPESVAELASAPFLPALELASEPVTVLHKTEIQSLAPQSSDFLKTSPGYFVTTMPGLPNVASGLSYNNLLDSYDPFSILPDIEGEPVPKQLLIRYCTCFLAT